MRLSILLERLEYTCIQGNLDAEILGIENDSRKVIPGSLFFCIRGAVTDGHTYAAEVAEKGARAILVEEPVEVPPHVTVIQVKDSRYAMALVAAAWYGYPAEQLKVIGVTGTKGKTTTTYMVKSILESAGHKVGLIGTIETVIQGEHIPSSNTTPESTMIQEYLRRMVDEGCDCAVMEVSSQGLMLRRTSGIPFEIGIFTNIEPDHIGPAEHKDFEEYMYCKGLLFKQCRIGIVNGDDKHLSQVLEGHTCTVETFGLSERVKLRAEDMRLIHEPGALGIAYHVSGLIDLDVEVDIPGKFSVYNSLAAIAVCRHFKVSDSDIKIALKQAKVKGRIELVKVSDEFTLMIDYAHNAMSLRSLLVTLREYHPKRLVCLFGCGGNRAKSRRYEMAEAAGTLADFTIITSDNPRYEKPEDILNDIEEGIRRTSGEYIKITDRKEAIAYAIHHGRPGDVIILAGKGHEDYQEICGEKHHMDERDLIREILEEDGKKSN